VKKTFVIAIIATMFLSIAGDADAARVVRTRTTRGRTTRVRVTVRPGFPIRRTLPNVVVRPGAVRIAPRTYLGAVAFTAAALATLPPANARAGSGAENLDREDGWTDFTLNLDRRGTGLLLEIDRGAAEISFAEVVFENGEAQVVDFDERVQPRGVYSLLDFRDGRKVDHVRFVAKAQAADAVIRVHLVS
jgi:hypothetical protein